jgi:filamentous hemagglutinin family protein
VTINQTAPQALLNWQTFNVGTNTTVDFNQQGNTSWTALNKIAASGVPSQILGQIKADGQVLLINQNGIIFGGTSQVNVHTLIASTLDTDASTYLNNGLFASNINFSGVSNTTGALFQGKGGTVTVQPGAVIDTTGNLSANGDGGFVALLGASVSNAGTIVTRNGQIILAADSSNIGLIQPSTGAVGTKTALQVVVGSGGAVVNDQHLAHRLDHAQQPQRHNHGGRQSHSDPAR